MYDHSLDRVTKPYQKYTVGGAPLPCGPPFIKMIFRNAIIKVSFRQSWKMVILEIDRHFCPWVVHVVHFMIKIWKTIHLSNCNFTCMKHAAILKMSISTNRRHNFDDNDSYLLCILRYLFLFYPGDWLDTNIV